MSKIKNVMSLFDGISCGQIALEKAGVSFDNYFASEIEESSIKVVNKNYPKTIQIGDVTLVKPSDYKDIDLLIAGSPCQSFSNLGSKDGFDGKSGLFWDFVRILKQINPKYFLLENVNMKKEWADIISETLGVKPVLINSNLVSAQNRPRLYWTNIPFETPKDRGILLKDVLLDIPFRDIPNFFYGERNGVKRINSSVNCISNKKSNCLTTKSTHPPQYLFNEDKTMCRTLSPEEFEILQTIPVGYTSVCNKTDRYRMLGNCWTVDVVAEIFKGIK